MTRAILPVIIAWSWLGAGCAPSETDNAQQPTVTLTLGLTGSQLDGAGRPLAVDSRGEAFTMTAAEATVRHIELKLPWGGECPPEPSQECDDDLGEVRVWGPWQVDLVAGSFDPPLGPLAIPAGTYRRVEVHVERATAAGEFELGGAPTQFALDLELDDEVRFEHPGGLAFELGGMHTAALLLDVSGWFEELPLSECAEAGDLEMAGGTMLVADGDDDCSDVETQLEKAIKQSGQLIAE